jgi:hypothetical protein
MATSTTKTFTSALIIVELERGTGLSAARGGILEKIHNICMPNENLYAALLYILNYGYDAINNNFAISGSDGVTITPDLYDWFVDKYIKENKLQNALKNTPAGQKNELENVGSQGDFSRLTAHNDLNVVTGPGVNAPCFGADLLNSIHPNMVNEIENFCNFIRTRSYLSLPSDAFGGITQAMWFVTGAVTAFYQAIVEIYQGMTQLINQVFIWINNIARMVQQYIVSVIEQIIPLDLICLVLSTVQTVLDDIGFFAQLFNGSDNLFNVLNSIQTVVNFASFGVNFAYNPLGGLAALFPEQANQVYNFISNIQNFPQAYLGKLVQNVGFGSVANNEGLQIANTIIQRFGLGAQLGPLQPILASVGTVGNRSDWYRTGETGVSIAGLTVYPYVIPNNLGGPIYDVNLNIFNWTGAAAADFNGVINNTIGNVSDDLKASGDYLKAAGQAITQ